MNPMIMGRADLIPVDTNKAIKFRMVRVRIDNGGYDPRGAYWGIARANPRLYWACSVEEVDTKWGTGYSTERREQAQLFIRAKSRAGAKKKVKAIVPNAKFFN